MSTEETGLVEYRRKQSNELMAMGNAALVMLAQDHQILIERLQAERTALALRVKKLTDALKRADAQIVALAPTGYIPPALGAIHEALADSDKTADAVIAEFLGEPVEIEPPEYHYEAMGCGLEDRGITDRYEAMQYGFECGVGKTLMQIPDEPLYAPKVKP